MVVFKSAFIILCACFLQQNAMAQSYFKKDYPNVWQRSTDYTLEVAAAMPAHQWSYKPAEKSMSFREQLVHLIQNIAYLSASITGNRPDFFKGKDPETLNQDEIMKTLHEAFDSVGRLIKTVDALTLKESIEFGGEKMWKENIFYLMRDHATHHRGQAILYLRMNGVKAPQYRGW